MTAASAAVVSTAPAKINLALHVVGRRADGYHELDSLVVFAEIGDQLEVVERHGEQRLIMDGPFAAGLPDGSDNLVLKALCAFETAFGPLPGLGLRLTKRLPVASGIGGGSADAAAALRLAASAAGISVDDPRLMILAERLGADVPMCLVSKPLRAEGIGERITAWTGLPALPVVLVNPGVAVSTPAVFRRLARRDNPAIPDPPAMADPSALAQWLKAATRNDLEEPAIAEAPVIAEVIAAIAALPGCGLARMSGSGATVFGLFGSDAETAAAAERIAAAQPGWWVVATRATTA